MFLFLFHSIPRIPTLIPRIPTPIPRIPTLIPRIPTPIPHIPTLIPQIPSLIPHIPILIPRIPRIPLIPFPDSLFWLLQIAVKYSNSTKLNRETITSTACGKGLRPYRTK